MLYPKTPRSQPDLEKSESVSVSIVGILQSPNPPVFPFNREHISCQQEVDWLPHFFYRSDPVKFHQSQFVCVCFVGVGVLSCGGGVPAGGLGPAVASARETLQPASSPHAARFAAGGAPGDLRPHVRASFWSGSARCVSRQRGGVFLLVSIHPARESQRHSDPSISTRTAKILSTVCVSACLFSLTGSSYQIIAGFEN